MIASSSWGLYLLFRDLFHFVHPWWARGVIIGGAVAGIAGWAVLSAYLEERKKQHARERRAQALANLPPRQRKLVSEALRLPPEERLLLVQHMKRRHQERTGTCESWIPEGFR